MWYFANPSNGRVHAAMTDHSNHLGMIVTPAQGNVVDPLYVACVDNGAFGKSGYVGDEAFLALVAEVRDQAYSLWFAVAPDVVGDAAATLERSLPMLPRIRALGVRAAFVAQNGQEHLPVPWDEFDVLFLGGLPECLRCGYIRPIDDKERKTCPSCDQKLREWKLGAAARELMAEALRRGKPGHMGRVNSGGRMQAARQMGCASADGTYLIKGPDTNLPKALGWLRGVNDQPFLWEEAS